MNFETLVMTVLRFAWGTLLTALITAALTMLLRHGNRWSRGVRKFLRTGRWMATGARGRGNPITASPKQKMSGAMPKLSVEQVLRLLGQSRNSSAQVRAPYQDVQAQNDVPLDLRF